MSDGTIAFLILLFSVFAVSSITNVYRQRRSYKIQLKPNCLLTRHPIVFVTGPRSIFYFKKYWNAYPEILTEHGYEVFTLHLPWSGSQRGAVLQKFIREQEILKKKYHFICDEITSAELHPHFEQSGAVASLTQFKSTSPNDRQSKNLLLNIGYTLHTLRFIHQRLPTSDDLGVHFPIGASPLLKRMQVLAEQDFLA